MIATLMSLLAPVAVVFIVVGMASLDEKVGEWEKKKWNS